MLRSTLLTLALVAAAPLGATPPKTASIAQVPADLPTGDRWLRHFREDLLPFWNTPDAWGQPVGNFPTFRANDGKALDRSHLPEELADAPGWIAENLDRDFVRMKSRQTFVYGVAFHLTGDPAMLRLAKAGVDWIRTQALDPATGSAVSYFEGGTGRPAVLARTSQDLAYAQLGLAMYWYLTRDPVVLKDLERLRAHIFSRYWNPDWKALRWVVTPTAEHDEQRQELVAQLDQVNAYLLLLGPLLPPPERTVWTTDLRHLAAVMLRDYHDAPNHRFWGTIHDPARKVAGSRHTDFGHTAKAYWMIGRIGRLLGDRAMEATATTGARALLQQAWLPATGTWASRLRGDGELDRGVEWWIYAELDQLAATLALRDPAQAAPLPRTAAFWFTTLVDPVGKEVWGGAGGPELQPWPGPKIHMWKSGYHSAEHALVGYLTAQALHGQAAVLHFAPVDAKAALRPYVFEGRLQSRSVADLPGFPGQRHVTATFTGLR